MKLKILKVSVLLMVAVAAFGVAGCATQGHAHSMGCSKCACKMMQAEASNPNKCKMCGHDAADHNHAAAQPDASEHSEHQH